MKTQSKVLDRKDVAAKSLEVTNCPVTLDDLIQLKEDGLATDVIEKIIEVGFMHRFSRISLGSLKMDEKKHIKVAFIDCPVQGANPVKTAEEALAANMNAVMAAVSAADFDKAKELQGAQDALKATLEQAKEDAAKAKKAKKAKK